MKYLLSVLLLLALAPLAAQQYAVSPAAAIPDNAPGLRSDINVSGGPSSIVSMRVRLTITHPRANDLSVWVVPPGLSLSPPYTAASMTGSGAYVLFQSIGLGADFDDVQFAASSDPGFGMATSLATLTNAGNPTRGLYAAAGMQGAFGTDANGTWGLVVVDKVNSQAGTLVSWGIDFARPGMNVWKVPAALDEWPMATGVFCTVMTLELIAPSGPQSLIGLTLQRSGTCTDSHLYGVRLIRDTDFNGYADTYDPQLDTDQAFAGGVAMFPSCGLNVTLGRAHVLVQLQALAAGASQTVGVQLAPAGITVSSGPLYALPISTQHWSIFGKATALPWTENFDGGLKYNLVKHTASGPAPAASGMGDTVGAHSYSGSVANGRIRVTSQAFSSQSPQSAPNHCAMDYRFNGSGFTGWSAIDCHFDLSGVNPATQTLAFSLNWASIREAVTPGDGIFLSEDGGATWFACAWKFPMVSGTVVPYQPATVDLSTALLAYGRTSFSADFVIRVQVAGTAVLPNGGILIDDMQLRLASGALRVREQGTSGALILNGAGVGGARDFGQQGVTSGPSAALTIHVSNSGTATVSLGTPSSTTSQFSVNTTGFSTTLTPGASTTFAVAFDPTSLGSKAAEITFTHSADGTTSPFRFGVSGVGVTAPALEVRVGSSSGPLVAHNSQLQDFGYHDPAAGPTAVVTAFIVNPSVQTWTLGVPQLSGTHSAQFVLNTSGFATSLGPSNATSFTIAFDPASPGPYSATLSFTHNSTSSGGPPNPFVMSVVGYGSGPVSVLVREGTQGTIFSNGDAASGTRDFGNQNISAGSVGPNGFSIFNTGQNVMTVSSLALSGTGASQYVLSAPTTSTQIAPGAYLYFEISFDPTVVGASPAVVSFTHNAVNTGSPFTFDLAGTGIVEPILEVRDNGTSGPVIPLSSAPANGRLFGFRDVSAGPSAYTTICIINTGNGDLILGTPTPGIAAYVLDLSSFNTTVTPGNFTTFGIAFDPVAVGQVGNGVYFSHNAAGSGFSINAQGTGTTGPLLDVREGSASGAQYGSGMQTWQDFGAQDVAAGQTTPVTLFFRNEGSADLTMSVPTLAGSDASQFALDTTGFVTLLTPGSSTTATIAFDPGQVGVKSCFVSLTHNSSARYSSPLNISFLGMGVTSQPLPEVQVRIGGVTGTVVSNGSASVGQLVFPARDIANGQTPYTQFFVLNTGQAALTLGTPSFGGGTGAFVFDTAGFQTTIAAGASTSFGIAFDPVAVGVAFETVNFMHDGANTATPFSFQVEGEGLAIAVLEVREGSAAGPVISYGAAPAGGRSFGFQEISAGPTAATTIVIRNTGSASMQLGNPIFNPTTTEFVIATSGFPTSLSPGASASFTVSFDPTSVGYKSAPVRFTHDAVWPASGFTFFWFEVEGDGLPDNAPIIEVREDTVAGPLIAYGSTPTNGRDFGSQDVNSGPTSALSIVVRNLGSGSMSVGQPDMTFGGGYDPNSFVIAAAAFPLVISPGGSASFTIAFDPSSAGQTLGQVRITHNSSAVAPTPFVFEVTGLGTGVNNAPVIEVREYAVVGPIIANNAAASGGRAFADRLLDDGPSAGLLIFVRNTGAGPLTLGTPQLTGADAPEFVLDTTGFTSVIPVGSSTSFSIAFDPSSLGAKSASVEFTHDAPFTTSSPFILHVTGTGITSTVSGGPGGDDEGDGDDDEGCSTGNSSGHIWLLLVMLALTAVIARRVMRSRV